jgi:hypothetical protein
LEHPLKMWDPELLSEMYRTEELCDTEIWVRNYDASTLCCRRAHKFVLSLISPVFRRMIHWEEKKRASRAEAGLFLTITLNDVFLPTLTACLDYFYTGTVKMSCHDLDQLIELGKLADLLDVSSLREAVVSAATRLITPVTCAQILQSARDGLLTDLEDKCTSFALRNLPQVTCTPCFLDLDEEVLDNLFADDRLTGFNEEALYEALLLWVAHGDPGRHLVNLVQYSTSVTDSNADPPGPDPIADEDRVAHVCRLDTPNVALQGCLGGPADIPNFLASLSSTSARGEHLFELVRFCAMADDYLRGHVSSDAVRLGLPVLAAAAASAAALPPHRRGRHCARGGSGPEAAAWRRLTWSSSGEMAGHAGSVEALAVHGRWLVSGARDGSVRLWGMESSKCEVVLNER